MILQLSGAVHPRIDFLGEGGMRSESHSFQTVTIRNDGALPIEVQSVSWPVTGVEDVVAGVLPPGIEGPTQGSAVGTAPLSEPFTLDRGEHRVIVVSGRETCPGSFGTGPVRVRARTAIGIERTVEVGHTDGPVFGAPCP